MIFSFVVVVAASAAAVERKRHQTKISTSTLWFLFTLFSVVECMFWEE